MTIPVGDIGFFTGIPESYCVRFYRECEKRLVSPYDLTKSLIIEFLDGRLVEVEKESFDVCVASADGSVLNSMVRVIVRKPF